jgi:hypothetical protein
MLVTREEASAEHDRVRRLARDGRVDDLIRELKNLRRFRLLAIRAAAATRLGLIGQHAAAVPLAYHDRALWRRPGQGSLGERAHNVDVRERGCERADDAPEMSVAAPCLDRG